MRFILLLAVTATLALSGTAHSSAWRELPAVAKVMAGHGFTGTFVVYDVEKDEFSGINRERAETRFTPASTFKIPNSVIGLATGAVRDVDEMFPWDGQPKYLPGWEEDMGLRQAMKVSNVPVYQEVARRVGKSRMQEMVDALDYGNRNIGTSIDTFWLDGALKISPVEQCLFLKKLALNELRVSADIQASVREITLIDSGSFGKLYAKTGTTARLSPGTGWWVGWVETPKGVKTFALNVNLHDGQFETKKRIELGMACLRAAEILQD